eukprot:gene18799-59760_t
MGPSPPTCVGRRGLCACCAAPVLLLCATVLPDGEQRHRDDGDCRVAADCCAARSRRCAAAIDDRDRMARQRCWDSSVAALRDRVRRLEAALERPDVALVPAPHAPGGAAARDGAGVVAAAGGGDPIRAGLTGAEAETRRMQQREERTHAWELFHGTGHLRRTMRRTMQGYGPAYATYLAPLRDLPLRFMEMGLGCPGVVYGGPGHSALAWGHYEKGTGGKKETGKKPRGGATFHWGHQAD